MVRPQALFPLRRACGSGAGRLAGALWGRPGNPGGHGPPPVHGGFLPDPRRSAGHDGTGEEIPQREWEAPRGSGEGGPGPLAGAYGVHALDPLVPRPAEQRRRGGGRGPGGLVRRGEGKGWKSSSGFVPRKFFQDRAIAFVAGEGNHPFLYGFPQGAAGLVGVGAVVEGAFPQERFELGEEPGQFVPPDAPGPEGAHARGVHHVTAEGELEEHGARCGVPARVDALLSHLPRLQAEPGLEGVEEGRLARPRGAGEGRGLSLELGSQILQADLFGDAREDDGETWSEPQIISQNTEHACFHPKIASDSQNNLYVIYELNTGNWTETSVQFQMFDGVSWSEPINLTEGYPGANAPQKVVIDSEDRVYVFFYWFSFRYRYLSKRTLRKDPIRLLYRQVSS